MRHVGRFRPGLPSKQYFACSRHGYDNGVAFSAVPYDFAEDEFELEPQACSAKAGGPPRKLSGIGVLDPPFPPKRPPGPVPSIPSSLFMRILAGLLLAGVVTAALWLLIGKH